jgi:hypothetical protein
MLHPEAIYIKSYKCYTFIIITLGVQFMEDIIKIKGNKSWRLNDIPRFSLTLKEKASEEQKRNINYDVLSKLVGNSDVIIELIGSYLDLPPNKRDSYSFEFLQHIRALGVEYRCLTVSSISSALPFLGFLGNRSAQEQNIMACIPNEVWSNTKLKSILPFHGAKYSVLKEKSNGAEVLDNLQKMLDSEKLDYFKLIAFDTMSLNSIGIYTNCYNLSDIKTMLGIS